ncbi:MAG: FAD-dependent oxidoreductase [Pseudomonadota bacterium]|nr:FAD-dependent oxidoreductase [Pseudomonadota bacterium]
MPRPTRSVAVYGAGIAGLAAAHEFARRGWQVTVIEENPDAGGFFRSARMPGDDDMPSEYSWHGMGPWYHNLFDLLKQIPFDDEGSLYEKALSRPIDFGVAPDSGTAQFDDSGAFPDVCRMFRMTRMDRLRWAWLMLKTWTAHRRSAEHYSTLNAAEQWRRVLTPTAGSTWAACFGPWIGSDWTRVSLHQAGLFFRRQLITQPAHDHAEDDDGPAWKQGARSGWLLLRGPSSEYWFQRWVAYLRRTGVAFHFEQTLHRLELQGERIAAGVLSSGESIEADVHVLAINPFAAADILDRTPSLTQLDELRKFRPLVQEGPHHQVSFRIAFAERIHWPRPRCAIVLADSEFDLTMFAQEQAWAEDIEIGSGLSSLWTVTACVSRAPGRIHGLPLDRCTRQQFIDEIRAQVLGCGALDRLIREANDGRPLASFQIDRIEIWHEWRFGPEGLSARQPKWVNSTCTQPWQPTQRTPVPNLALAGAHTATDADLWSIEAAVESGRRAARIFESDVAVLPQYRPRVLRWLGAIDDRLYSVGAPHVLTVLIAVLVAGLMLGVALLIA